MIPAPFDVPERDPNPPEPPPWLNAEEFDEERAALARRILNENREESPSP